MKYVQTILCLALVFNIGCSQLDEEQTMGSVQEKESSHHATFVDMTFSGTLIASNNWNPERTIEQQLLYTIGQLNGDRAVGRLDRLDIRDLDVKREDGSYTISYTVTMPVAWDKSNPVPETYEFISPIDMTYQNQTAFTDKYKDDCVDWSAHDVTSGSMWYYYRPGRYACRIDESDVARMTASVEPSVLQTEGKYPEYDQVWKDGRLEVIAIFGRASEDKPKEQDIGTRNFRNFVKTVSKMLPNDSITRVPENPNGALGIDVNEVRIEGQFDDGRALSVTVMMVDNVRTAGAEFNDRYRELTPTADLIIYNGHAGLGRNIRALASKGDWAPEQYVVVYMNGCDTYAYVDDALYAAHRDVNPDDEVGTRYVDLVTNAMPAYFSDMIEASMALTQALADPQNPKTYDEIFANIAKQQLVLVTGEEDNTYDPDTPSDVEPTSEPAPTPAVESDDTE